MRSIFGHSFKLGKHLVRGAVTALFFLSSGCSFFSPCTEKISVLSDPLDARVFLNGVEAGKTPLVYTIRRDKPVTVVLFKEGFQSVSRTLDVGLSSVGIVDLISGSGWIVPYLGLLSAGAWDFDNPDLLVSLAPLDICQQCENQRGAGASFDPTVGSPIQASETTTPAAMTEPPVASPTPQS